MLIASPSENPSASLIMKKVRQCLWFGSASHAETGRGPTNLELSKMTNVSRHVGSIDREDGATATASLVGKVATVRK